MKRNLEHGFRAYFKDYRFKGILIRYFLILFCFLVVPTTALNLLYGSRLTADTRKEILQNSEYSLRHSRTAFDANLIAVKKLAYTLAENEGLRYLSILGKDLASDAKGELDSYKGILAAVQQTYGYLDSIYVYLEAANAVITAKGSVVDVATLADDAWLEDYTPDMARRILLRVRGKSGIYPHLLSVMYPIYPNVRHCVGMVVINVNVELLGQHMGTGAYRQAEGTPKLLVFADGVEKPVYSDEFRLLRDEPEELAALAPYRAIPQSVSEYAELWGRSYVISTEWAELDGLQYMYLTPMSLFEEQQENTRRLLMQTIFVSLTVCVVLAVLFARWAYRPIRETRRIAARSAGWAPQDRREHLDEMQEIQRAILAEQSANRMLSEEIRQRLECLQSAQLCALQSQINPHFLYNTLEAIRSSVITLGGGENRASDMLLTLARLMRLSLSSGRYLVSLQEELEHVKLYVQIMDFRYNGRVQVHLEVPETLLKEKTIKLTLQPLIENAIEHGLRYRHFQGDVWVRCHKDGSDLHIFVVDNGVGMDEQALSRLRVQLDEDGLTDRDHIGLRNVHQRLRLVFGEDFGLTLEASPEGGLCVGVHIKTMSELEVPPVQ